MKFVYILQFSKQYKKKTEKESKEKKRKKEYTQT